MIDNAMLLRFSRHARNRMRRHKISEELISSVIDSPDSQTPTIKGRTNAAKVTEDRIIRVTYVREAGQTVVITVSPRRRL